MPEERRTETASEAPKRKRRRPNKNFYAILAVGLGLIGILLLLSVVFPKQNATRRRLEEEREAKERELTELRLKKESLQELAALIGNRDFLIRYLREHQGYMYPGDIRVDLADPNALIPTPMPVSEETPAPTADPDATEDPELTEDPEATEAPDENGN